MSALISATGDGSKNDWLAERHFFSKKMAEMSVPRPGGMGAESEEEEDQLSPAVIIAQNTRHCAELLAYLDAENHDGKFIGGGDEGQGAVSVQGSPRTDDTAADLESALGPIGAVQPPAPDSARSKTSVSCI